MNTYRLNTSLAEDYFNIIDMLLDEYIRRHSDEVTMMKVDGDVVYWVHYGQAEDIFEGFLGADVVEKVELTIK